MTDPRDNEAHNNGSHSPAPAVHELGVKDLLRAYRSQQISPVEVVEHLLERIDRLDRGPNGINCVVDTLPELALTAARHAHDLYAKRAGTHATASTAATLPPLLGVPFLIKEQHDLAGHSATRGSQTRAGQIAQADHPIVARLRAAGAIPLGRTTTPEFSCATFSQTREWGISRNPFNRDKTPGGSSGGSGGAVAAGFAPFATASDIAGSTRIPAAFNGLPGFKAPYGSTPGIHPMNNDWYRGDHILARSVADTAYVFNQITGVHPCDHTTVPVAQLPHEFGISAGTAPAGTPVDAGALLEGKKVAVSPNLGAYALDPSVAQGVDRVAEALAGAGASVQPVDVGLSLDQISRASMAHFGHIFGANLYRSTGGDLSGFEPYTQLMIEQTMRAASEMTLVESLLIESTIQDTLARALEGFDVLVTGTSALEDLDAGDHYLGSVTRATPGQPNLGFYWEGHMTVPFNIANRHPVMAMPSGVGSAGVPTSVQIVGHPYDSVPVLEVAQAVEVLVPRPVPQLG